MKEEITEDSDIVKSELKKVRTDNVVASVAMASISSAKRAQNRAPPGQPQCIFTSAKSEILLL